MRYKTILFDMDGTIADSFEVISQCVAYALEQFGISVTDKNSLRKFVGPPLKYSFTKFWGFSELQAITAIDYYTKKYAQIGGADIKIYSGIPQLLNRLKDSRARLAVASTKPLVSLTNLCNQHNISQYFECLGGSDAKVGRTEKWQVINWVLSQMGVSNKSDVVLVGDRCFDLDGAMRCGIDCVGVLYGYGGLEDFGSLPRVAELATVAELEKWLFAE